MNGPGMSAAPCRSGLVSHNPALDVGHLRSAALARIEDAARVIGRNVEHLDAVASITGLLVERFESGHKVLLCGNGGSAADAEHIAGEFVGRVRRTRRPLPALALLADVASLSGVANDFGFEEVFARWVEAIGVAGDVAILLSTSGRSENVLRAAAAARSKGIVTVGFSGSGGGALTGEVDIPVVIASDDTGRVQEAYLNLLHIVAALVEEYFCGEPAPSSPTPHETLIGMEQM